MHKQLFISVAIALASLQPFNLLANSGQQNPNPVIQQEAWLGVGLGRIPSILRSQLASVIPLGQGVMITAVADNSPAAVAGLLKHDVILSSGNQKIYSPGQLTGLVKAAQPGSNLNLTIVRQGKQQELSVELGKRDKPVYRQMQPWQPQFGNRWSMPSMPQMQPPTLQGNNQFSTSWDSFESVQVRTLPDGRYHAEVKYKDPQGNEKSFSFEGKREEIIKQINQQKELPEAKKKALLNALNMRPGSMFNDPFFNDPFFQRGFPQLNMPGFQQYFQRPPAMPEPYSQGNVL